MNEPLQSTLKKYAEELDRQIEYHKLQLTLVESVEVKRMHEKILRKYENLKHIIEKQIEAKPRSCKAYDVSQPSGYTEYLICPDCFRNLHELTSTRKDGVVFCQNCGKKIRIREAK